ncbi:Oxalyl-CoA synthetase [Cladobotryum mycophilum]|uniref:Oxalyl-CoA synthetase n=1 Tax=Cladobotryum mycophilum TaxID=491253 RepID=A0ABR0T167_9HYPO
MDSEPLFQGLPTLLRGLSDLPPSQVKASGQFQSLRRFQGQKDQILASIPYTHHPIERTLGLLHLILTEIPGPWPTIPLITTYTRLSKLLPEEVKSNPDSEQAQLARATCQLVKKSYNSFADFLSCESRPALRSVTPENFITHKGLHDFVKNFQLPVKDNGRKPAVAIALPNGPLLAAVCVAVTTYYTSAPINQATGPGQFRADITQAGAQFILTTADDCERLGLTEPWVAEAGILVCLVDWKGNDQITITNIDGTSLPPSSALRKPNQADDFALILFTSGTSGTKSGGLVRNIFAPIFSGGSTVCCPAFDPNLFWDVAEDIQPTWYYASPSMHSVILAEASARPQALQKSRIRLACNAAGGLLPSLACQLRDTFNCTVLPSYGMTECMPITTPPIDYRLDREGTSGVSTGPELTILDWSDETVPHGSVGRICVRGEPVFPGYLRPDGTLDKSPFNVRGWFDTGDLGYMDKDGYLYITGRSKEVINRGGELISPFEVENAIMSAALSEASPISGRVSAVLAFSAPHNVLQEVVAVALIPSANAPRIDLRTLHKALRSSLQQVKWPVFITYMDDLPKKNNKTLASNMPPGDTDLSVPIESSPCSVDYKDLSRCLDTVVPVNFRHHNRQKPDSSVELFVAPAGLKTHGLKPQFAEEMKEQLSRTIHNYMIPERVHLLPEPLPRVDCGNVDDTALDAVLQALDGSSLEKLEASTEGKVTKTFADILSRSPNDIPLDVDFFGLGGDSLRAGRLVSSLRSTFNIQLPIGIVFNQGTVTAIATHIDTVLKSMPATVQEDPVFGCETTYSSTNPFLMLLQLVPIVIIYPMRRAFQWTTFIVALSYVQTWPTSQHVLGRLFNVTLCIMLAQIMIGCIAPFVGIFAKWVIIGRYREGLYPMWGSYHTRWWMVQKIVSICGKGIFNTTDTTKRIYLLLMGAKIGKNVKLAGASLGEWDLLDIRDGASLTRCICRPFAAEGNTTMYLGRIVIGENSSVGMASIIAAGSEVPPDTCIGPNSSSWELQDADETNRDLSPSRAPKPHWLLTCLFTLPLTLIAWFLSLLPWIGGLIGMVLKLPSLMSSPLRDILDWFTDPERIGYHYLALILRCFFSPFILFALAVIIKLTLDVMFGPLVSGPANGQGTINIWRASLIKTLMPTSRLHDMTGLFGQHYEATSIALRMLGAKIGKRVYWPGTGPVIGDYHLLDIGNDVVFGSRAHLITSDGTGSEKITVGDRAMIADRVCLLPGVDIGEHTTMGSGALTRRGNTYPTGATFVGSKGGDAVYLSSSQRTSQEKPKSRIRHMSSDDTLNGKHAVSKNQRTRGQIQHMSSDETLAESRHSKAKRDPKHYDQKPDPSATIDSDSDETTNGISNTDNLSPFGRAFYLKQAPYRVLGPLTIFCYSSFITIFTSFYWNIASVSSIQIVDLILNHHISRTTSFWYQVAILYLLSWAATAVLATAQAILALAIVIGAKWALLGRRTPGNYDWDKSPYCQRWQIFLSIEKLRRHCYRGQGVLGLLTGTNWIVLYFRALGAKIGKDCALFANGSPSLMFTEPDLITLGDRVTIDDASVVAHINTRGKFDLNRLEIGDRCVMRTGSRLLSGATMRDDSCLLEHTLIMGGDIVESKWTMQGWPAEKFSGQRVKI